MGCGLCLWDLLSPGGALGLSFLSCFAFVAACAASFAVGVVAAAGCSAFGGIFGSTIVDGSRSGRGHVPGAAFGGFGVLRRSAFACSLQLPLPFFFLVPYGLLLFVCSLLQAALRPLLVSGAFV